MNKIKIYMGIPTVGTVVDLQTFSLRAFEKRYGDRVEFVYPEHCVQRIFHDYARNAIVEEFLKTDCDVLMFLDSDIAPPEDLLDEYLKYYDEWNVAGAPYPVFMSQPGKSYRQVVYTVYRGLDDGYGMAPTDVPKSGIDYVSGVATGCMLIKRHVLEKIEQPWFEHKYDPKTRALIGGEDIGFCRKVAALGYKFFIDYSKPCQHYKTVGLVEVNNYAIEYAQCSVNTYASMIKGQLLAVQEKYDLLKAELKNRSKSKIIIPSNVNVTNRGPR